jgi:hypothetical protein
MENKSKFEVRFYKTQDGQMKKDIFINDELLDYSIDISSYREACQMGHQFKVEAQKSIEKHFTECVSEVLGRKVTLDDIKKAIATGWI